MNTNIYICRYKDIHRKKIHTINWRFIAEFKGIDFGKSPTFEDERGFSSQQYINESYARMHESDLVPSLGLWQLGN